MANVAILVAELEANVPLLPAKDQGFAKDLVNGYKKWSRISEKQLFWVEKLISRAKGTEAKAPVATASAITGLAGLVELLKLANQHLKYPKVALPLNGKELRLSLCGPKSKNAGKVNVAFGRYGDPDGAWFGCIDEAGNWNPRNNPPQEVIDLVNEFSGSPASVASRLGKLLGNCVFCSLPLSDERSTEVGYGPICAKHYHLPWG